MDKSYLKAVGITAAFMAVVGATAVLISEENQREREQCQADPSTCKPPSSKDNDFMIVPMGGGYVVF